MSGAIVITNLDDVLRDLGHTAQQVDFAAKFAIGITGAAVERQAKLNANTGTHKVGEPRISGGIGPNVVTGNLRRSIFSRTRIGFGTYIAEVGATMEYARQVEQGGGRWKSGVKYPYIAPAAEKLRDNGTLSRTFAGAFASQLRG
jgi:hypothetical protein